MMNNEAIVSSIKQLCKNNNITVTQLEKEIGMSQGLVSKWKDKVPSLDKIIDIADYFHTTLDEVVGHTQNIYDDFLNTLHSSTDNKMIQWSLPNEIEDYPIAIISPSDHYNEEIYTTTQYCARYMDACMIMYSYHKHNHVLEPILLQLYIQTSADGSILLQPYNREELKPLWIKILNSLDEFAPIEVKAENLKSKFIFEFKNKLKKTNSISIDMDMEQIISEIEKENGCVLCNLETNRIFAQNGRRGHTSAAEDFYNQYKDLLGEVKQARMINGRILILISESYIMKFSGLTCGHNTGMTGYNGFLRVMADAGFDISDETIFDEDNFTLHK